MPLGLLKARRCCRSAESRCCHKPEIGFRRRITPALRSAPSRDALAPERYVEVEFTVRADGHVERERVLTREAGKSAADETLQALQAARYRPRIVDGKPVDTEGVRHRQTFK